MKISIILSQYENKKNCMIELQIMVKCRLKYIINNAQKDEFIDVNWVKIAYF